MKKGLSQEIKERVETIEGVNIVDASKQRYLVEQRSYRWLQQHWGVNNRTVRRILECCGIAIRHGGDAVATQWVGNTERRQQASINLANINHRLALEGRHIRQGKTKANSELIRQISEKLKETSAFLRPEVRAKSIANSLATRRKYPERMSALRKPMSESEEIISAYLTAKGFPFQRNVFFAPTYVADFFVPSLRLVVDCQGRSRFPLSYKRHKSLSANGIYVAYCMNDFVKRRIFTHLDEYISRLQSASLDPTMACEESVIFGACGNSPFGDDSNKFFLNRLGVRSNYYTILTTASND